jgi:hypothetical protein
MWVHGSSVGETLASLFFKALPSGEVIVAQLFFNNYGRETVKRSLRY